MKTFYVHTFASYNLRKFIVGTQCLISTFQSLNKFLSLINAQAYAYAKSYAQAFHKHLGVYFKQYRSYQNKLL